VAGEKCSTGVSRTCDTEISASSLTGLAALGRSAAASGAAYGRGEISGKMPGRNLTGKR
jgi:hypothetical protein